MPNAKFNSFGEFFSESWQILKLLPRMRKARVKPIFRETICLSVTYANNCGP